MKNIVKKIVSAVLVSTIAVSLVACGGNNETKNTVLRIGASPSPHSQILEHIKPALKEKGIDLQIEVFTDYILPNKALDGGDIDANYFQHLPYLEEFNEKNNTELVSAGAIHFEPLGLYPGKTATIEEIKDGAEIAIPNDRTNEARALQLLEKLGLIKIKEGVGLGATVFDITSNPKNIKLVEVEAAQIPRTITDIDMGVANGNYALAAGIADTAIATEASDSEGAKEFANIIAVKKGSEKDEKIVALIQALQSDDVKSFMNEQYGSIVVPVF